MGWYTRYENNNWRPVVQKLARNFADVLSAGTLSCAAQWCREDAPETPRGLSIGCRWVKPSGGCRHLPV